MAYSDYKFTWRGATVLREINQSVDTAMENLRSDIEDYLQNNLHRYTGEMAEMSFAEIEAVQGRKRKLVVGSDSPHTLHHEFRYHPQLRETMDIWAPKMTEYIQQALRG